MHLSTNLEYPWLLQITDDELSVLQMVLRGDELTEEDEERADKLSSTLDMIREKAERTRGRHRPRRSRGRRRRPDDADPELLLEDYDSND